MKEYEARGLKAKIPLIGDGICTDEFVLPFMGEEAVGYVGALHYSAALQTKVNQEFVTKYRAKYNRWPSMHSEATFTTAKWIDEALKKIDGKFTKKDFMDAIRTVRFEAPRGPVSLDEYGNPIHNVYIRKVERTTLFGYKDPELWNVVIKTYPNVSQFWTWTAQEFLRQPVYSRDWPPCRYCE